MTNCVRQTVTTTKTLLEKVPSRADSMTRFDSPWWRRTLKAHIRHSLIQLLHTSTASGWWRSSKASRTSGRRRSTKASRLWWRRGKASSWRRWRCKSTGTTRGWWRGCPKLIVGRRWWRGWKSHGGWFPRLVLSLSTECRRNGKMMTAVECACPTRSFFFLGR